MNEQDTQQLTTADMAYGRNGKAQSETASTERDSTQAAELLPSTTTSSYRERWTSIQADFVDKPKDSVREADGLVAEVIQDLARSFADQREQLEGQWSSGSDVSTEDLRQALQQYRSFFQRLLAA